MYTQISTEAARSLIRDKSPVILDVRDVQAYSDARIPGAIHVTLSTLKSVARQFRRDTPLLIYCYRGHASRDFAELFADFGFGEVYSLDGGFQAWHAGNAEIERPTAGPPVVHSDPLTDWLLDQGGDPDHPNGLLSDGGLPLIKACQQGQADIAEALIEAGADIRGTDGFGNDALWAACYSGDLRTIGVLMEAGIDLNRQNRVGATALIYTASAGKTEVVAFLLEAGADPELRTEDDFTALELASNLEILRLLRRRVRSAA
jgi:rhodanese-related sulfurtransferase